MGRAAGWRPPTVCQPSRPPAAATARHSVAAQAAVTDRTPPAPTWPSADLGIGFHHPERYRRAEAAAEVGSTVDKEMNDGSATMMSTIPPIASGVVADVGPFWITAPAGPERSDQASWP